MTLLTHLWQSTACVALAALLTTALRQAPARTRHMIWLGASLKFLVPVTLLVEIGRIGGAWMPASPLSVAAGWVESSIEVFSLDVAPGPVVMPASLAVLLLLVWAGGATAIGWSRWRTWRALSRLAAAARPLQQGREADALRRVACRSAQRQPPGLLACPAGTEPAVIGVRRPRILWPAALSARLNDGELDAILAHELCHVDRRDNASAVLQIVVETLFWFHPVVWWLGSRLVSERERACDEEVLRMGVDKRTYAEGILEVCGFCLRVSSAGVSAIGGSDLAQRIERIMRHRRAPRLTAPGQALLLVAGLLVIGGPVATGAISAPAGQDSPARPGQGTTSPRVIHEVKPVYTKEAMNAGIQGSVLLDVVVLADGTVGTVTVTRSLDAVHGLDDEAVKAVKQWRFAPGTRDGKPVPVLVEIEMTFKLK